MRPEPFGALLYHFGTRKLSFLKDRRLLQVVQSLAERPSALAACREAGVSDAELPSFRRALQALRESQMLVARDVQSEDLVGHRASDAEQAARVRRNA